MEDKFRVNDLVMHESNIIAIQEVNCTCAGAFYSWEVVNLVMGGNESKWAQIIRNGSKLPEMGPEWIRNRSRLSEMGQEWIRNGAKLTEMGQ